MRKASERGEGRAVLVGLGGAEAELLAHHRLRPQLAVGGDDVDDAFEVVALEALGGVDLADLLALALGHELDVELLLAPGALAPLALGARAEEVARAPC